MMRTASCQCGQLRLSCDGEPIRVSVCHCLGCQRRSGSAFAVQARFPRDRVTVSGRSRQWTRIADSGRRAVQDFCPVCGSTVFYTNEPDLDVIAVPVGSFADLDFPGPAFSFYGHCRHSWVNIASSAMGQPR